ncbi:MAG: hypothetical protein A2017_11210 [Lentisphaerae bacterium GWF2_44_16]|nr:MAG: hypothetical protein A2017_11210 [Lentisphaerae bacterium GWF2_44_16]
MKISTLPLSLYTITMGLAGYTIALRTLSLFGNMGRLPYHVPFFIALAVFLTTTFFFLVKATRYPETLRHDWRDPLHINLFPAVSISLLLLSIAGQTIAPNCAWYCWLFGTILHGIFSIAVMKTWVEESHFGIEHFNTLWFIPIVGNILVPIMGTQYGFLEMSWFFFAIGFAFWALLMPLIMYRLFFATPLPKSLAPSMFILVAPPAAGFIAYFKLTHQVDPLAHILLYLALFFFVFVLIQAIHRGFGKFSLSWWATVFPSTALATALLVIFHAIHASVFLYSATALLIGTTLWLLILLPATIKFIAKN